MDYKNLLKTHQQAIVLSAGYVLVAAIGFFAGQTLAPSNPAPEIKIEQAFAPLNDTAKPGLAQSPAKPDSGQSGGSPGSDCAGKIKGNIGSGNSRIYHVPGGAFYARTAPEMCFETEAQAQAAGFRKSSR